MEYLLTLLLPLAVAAVLIAFYSQKLKAYIKLEHVDREFVRRDLYQELLNDRNEKEAFLTQAKTENAVLKNQLKSEMEKVETEKARLATIKAEMTTNFEALASRITRNNTDHFKKDSAEQLDQVLKPLNASILKIERQIKETNDSRIKETTELRGELKQLGKLNHDLQMEASHLTKALTMNPKQQGNWGEQVLETLLQKAGLVKNLHYQREVTGHTDENRLRADVIISLPEERHLVIDSKVSLNAYNRSCATEGAEAQLHMKDHVQHLRKHIDTLARKRYEDLYQIDSPDMVLMFLPIEGSLISAVQFDPDLFHYAIDRNVMITTSSTLFVSLKLVADLWQKNKQFENATEIATEAGKLHGQVMKFLEDMGNIEKSLNNAKTAYDSAFKRLSTGNNNIVRVATRIEDLGAKVKPGQKSGDLMKKLAS